MISRLIPARRFAFLFLLAGMIFTLASFYAPASVVSEVLSSTNQYRKANSLPALQMREDLNSIARKHSQDMANGRRSFGHDGFEQRHKQVKKIFQSCTMSENVAYGKMDGDAAVDMWKNSAGHRQNLLGNYRYVGIGVATDKKGVSYFTQIFVR
jgi:uncharacterized protein YkwD